MLMINVSQAASQADCGIIGSRTLLCSLWILGTLSQTFGFLLAQVPSSDSVLLGSALLLALIFFACSVFLGWNSRKPLPRDEDQSLPVRKRAPGVAVISVIGIVQLCLCVYWLVDLVLHAQGRS